MQRADAKLAFTSIVEAADAVTDYLDDRTAGQGVQFGIGAMHELTGPMMAGELFLVAGRPGMGKSVLGTNIALRVAAPLWWREQEFSDNLDAFSAGEAINARYHLGLPESAGVMEINGEMSGGQMMRRHYADIGFAMFGDRFPSYKDIRLKHVSTEQRAMVDEVKAAVRDWPLVMVKRSGLKVSQLRSMARRQTAKWLRDGVKPGLLILDHVGLLRPEGRTTGRYEAQTEIAIGLHQLADDLGLPILALVQMNREAEKRDNKRPQLSDLRDSGGWEENADVVIFPFREAYYALREDAPDDNKNAGADWATWDARCRSKAMEIIPGKVREGGAGKPQTIWCDVAWNALRPTEPRAKGAMI
jgi:replicative DNA helicase